MNRVTIAAYLNTLLWAMILAVAVIIPLLFVNVTTDFYDMPKLVFLVVSVLAMLVIWTLSWVIQGKVLITKTPLDLSLLLLAIVVLASTFFSDSKFIAILGNFPRVHGTAITWATYILLYFIVASNIKNWPQVKNLVYALLLSATLLAILSLLSYFKVFLPLPLAKAVNFTPTGSSFSTSSFLALLLPVCLISILNINKFLPQIPALVLASLYSVVIVLIGDISTIVGGFTGLVLTVLVAKRSSLKSKGVFLAIPILIAIIIGALGLIPIGKLNPFKNLKDNFPREIRLSFPHSWNVSGSAFVNSPFLGAGPSTYLNSFTMHKPASFNQERFWNVRFDSAFNEYLQVFGTLGILGILAFILLTLVILNFAWMGLSHKSLREGGQDDYLTLGLSITSIVAVIMMFLHTSTLTFSVITFILLAILMVMHKLLTGKVEDLAIGIKTARTSGDSNIVAGDILPIIFFIPVVIMAIVGLWYTLNLTKADYYHRRALNAVKQKPLDTYNDLVKAETANPWADLYRTDLAQTNFAIANAIAAQKGPSEASPGGSLTDEDKANIQRFLSQSINEAKNATFLNPQSAANWEILASIYRQITGVAQNALGFSLDAYGKAIQRDPLNPQLRLNVGGVYYSIKNYDLAIRFFSDAANLKPDYANAYYNLSVALRDKGDLRTAQAAAERVVSILQKDTSSQDYKTASEYLADLKTKASTISAQPNVAGTATSPEVQQVPPAAEETSALQNENLPKLPVDLKDRETVATPEAVKRPTQKGASPLPSKKP